MNRVGRHLSIDTSTAPHGTRARYVGQRCRCESCRAANTAYYHDRMRRRREAESAIVPSGPPGASTLLRRGRAARVRTCPGANGSLCVRGGAWLKNSTAVCAACVERVTVWNGLVSAGPARAHLMKLRRAGVGYKSVAAASDVGKTVLCGVLDRSVTQIRAETAKRILAVDADARADASIVTAQRMNRQITEMRGAGFTLRALAHLLGYAHPDAVLQLGIRPRALAVTRRRVDRLYRKWRRGEVAPSSPFVDAAKPYALLESWVARGLDRRWLSRRLEFVVQSRPPARMRPANAARVYALAAEIEEIQREGAGLPEGWQSPKTTPASAWGFDGGWSIERHTSKAARRREEAELRQLARRKRDA